MVLPQPSRRLPGRGGDNTELPIEQKSDTRVADQVASGLDHLSAHERVAVLDAVMAQSSDALVLSSCDAEDPVVRVRFVNDSFTRLLGYAPDEIAGRSPAVLLSAETAPETLERLGSGVGRGETVSEDLRLVGRGGEPVEVRGTYRRVGKRAEATWYLASYVERSAEARPSSEPAVVSEPLDLSGRSRPPDRAEELLAEQAEMLDSIAKGAPLESTLAKVTGMVERHVTGVIAVVGVVDADGVVHMRTGGGLSPDMCRCIDEQAPAAPTDEVFRGRLGELFVVDLRDHGLAGSVRDHFAAHGLAQARVATLRAPGSGEVVGWLTLFHRVAVELAAADVDVLGRAVNTAAIAIERGRFEAALEHQAFHDPLTDLPNRALLSRRLEESLERLAHGRSDGVAVLFMDLDRFKVINDSEGHAIGDHVLRQVADRLRHLLRPGETLGRFGGDEFMILCQNVRGESDGADAARRFADQLSEPILLEDGSEHFVTTSIGIAFTADPAVPAESLIRNADVAMYRAKDQGRNQRVVFHKEQDRPAVDQLTLERALRSAIEAEQFELHYQPVVRLLDGATTQVEALVRWNRPGLGQILPEAFIPLAEETGLIVPIGWWVLGEAVAEVAGWPQLPSGCEIEVAVNLSARQLGDPRLADAVADALDNTGLDAARLCFEVTESALVHDVAAAVASLDRLKALGVRIAIDDFGTGYATLDYVRHFSMADYLKIDRAFVEGVDRPGSQEAAIVSAAINLAKSLGFTVVAEGVETQSQMEALRELECELAQGFLFSRPLPPAEVVELLRWPRV